MHTVFADRDIPYTGAELRPLWILDTFGVQGDAMAAFLGPCDVTREHMVDRLDVLQGATIRAARMLHFIVEQFSEAGLLAAVLSQRLLVCVAAEVLRGAGIAPERRGDDLFVGPRKLSVSIATISAVSSLIHLGLNVDPAGAPVPAVGLAELGLDVREVGEAVLHRYAAECEAVREARCKVRAVL